MIPKHNGKHKVKCHICGKDLFTICTTIDPSSEGYIKYVLNKCVFCGTKDISTYELEKCKVAIESNIGYIDNENVEETEDGGLLCRFDLARR
jgi:hypothetical protein